MIPLVVQGAVAVAKAIASQPRVHSVLDVAAAALAGTEPVPMPGAGFVAPQTIKRVSAPTTIGPTSGLGVKPMSLLGNGFDFGGSSNGNGGFMSSSGFGDLARSGIQLFSALRSQRATASSLPGAGFLPGLPGPIPGLPGPAEAGARVGTAIGRRVRSAMSGKLRRRINPLNVRAARRAIRRIKAVRKITAQIERALPTRRVGPRIFAGSPGVITRREAARALRR